MRMSRLNLQKRSSTRLNLHKDTSSGPNLQNSPSDTTNAAEFAAWTPRRAMERELIACYGEGKEIKKTVEEKKPGQDAPAGV